MGGNCILVSKIIACDGHCEIGGAWPLVSFFLVTASNRLSWHHPLSDGHWADAGIDFLRIETRDCLVAWAMLYSFGLMLKL
jgi:hypothetical protein